MDSKSINDVEVVTNFLESLEASFYLAASLDRKDYIKTLKKSLNEFIASLTPEQQAKFEALLEKIKIETKEKVANILNQE